MIGVEAQPAWVPMGPGQAITDDAGRAGGAAALQHLQRLGSWPPHLVSETTRCLPLMGRLACIKSTLYGNVELLQRRLFVDAISVGWSTLMRILLMLFLFFNH